MSGFDDKCRQRMAEAVVDTLRKLDTMDCTEQIEVSGIAPLMHNGETIEQWHVILLRYNPHAIEIRRYRNHGFSARAVLRIYQNQVDSRILRRSNAFIKRRAKIIGIDRSHGVNGAGLPEDQGRPFIFQQLNEAAGSFLGGFLDLYFY